MALIRCEKCGKAISDTIEKCIHCGNPVNENRSNSTSADENTAKCNEESINFDDFVLYKELMEHERIELELEFCHSDKWALKYVQKIHEPKSIQKIAGIADAFGFICLLLISTTNADLHNIQVYSMGIMLGIFTGVVGLAITVLSLVLQRIHLGSVKKNLYYFKKFQIWLHKEKNIIFYPDFATLKAKEQYDNITEEEVERL
ncbi:MAG: hypothetical protein E7649_06825 [Ruminococcaceae bacterium]|nr:hypothetical protein [Oscillospiraceae bacterium]